MKLIHFCLAVSLTANFCSAQTTTSHTLQHNGLTREYRVYVPASYSSANPVPLVLNLHGYTSNNQQQEVYGDFRPVADTAGFILVHPNGTLDGSSQRFWNAWGLSTPDDVGFISALIDKIQQDYAIDPNCIYSAGMSNGGFMSVELACALSNRIAAVGSVTGSMPLNRMGTCNPGRPVPYIHIHGTADATVPYAGTAQFAGIENLVEYWADKNGCNPVPVMTPVPNTNTTDGCTAERYVYGGGTAGSTVELFKVIGGAHTWPGASLVIGVTNQDFKASGEIWRFFRQYKLNELASVNELEVLSLVVYPNPSSGHFVVNASEVIYQVVVTDLNGKIIQEFNPSAQSFEVKDLTNGVYFIRVNGAKSSRIEKVVVADK
jgi:polyhydroxybutyrate depolymerase